MATLFLDLDSGDLALGPSVIGAPTDKHSTLPTVLKEAICPLRARHLNSEERSFGGLADGASSWNHNGDDDWISCEKIESMMILMIRLEVEQQSNLMLVLALCKGPTTFGAWSVRRQLIPRGKYSILVPWLQVLINVNKLSSDHQTLFQGLMGQPLSASACRLLGLSRSLVRIRKRPWQMPPSLVPPNRTFKRSASRFMLEISEISLSGSAGGFACGARQLFRYDRK